MRFTLFVIKFLLLSAFFIVSNQNLALIDEGNRQEFVDQYKNWASGVAGHVGSLTAYVVRVEWLPQTGEISEDVLLDGDKGPRYSRVKR